jgi:hypothetical protein
MKVAFGTRTHLLTQWTKVTTTKCQQFAQWYNGNNSVKLDAPFQTNVTQHKVIALNCKAKNNFSLVCQYKVQLHIIDQLILHVLKNHLTTATYKLFLAHKKKFSFTDKKTGNKVHSSLILMRKMLDKRKPETIIEVHHLEKELITVVIWPMHENNVCLLTTQMMTVLQEIHAKPGKDSYTDQRFITDLFRALKISPTEKFLALLDQLKRQWIMEDILEPAEIIQKLNKMHCNMVAEGSWINTNEKDTKIVALTSAIQEVKKKFGNLAKKVSFDGFAKGGSPGKNGGSTSANKQQTKACCPEWQVTK